MRYYEYSHVVGFQETNLVGNVYYSNFLSWQGRCREMFLRDHCPDVLDELARDLGLLTSRCSCEYASELVAFDEVLVRMSLKEMVQNRITLAFEYRRKAREGGAEELVARGEQQVVVMRRAGDEYVPAPIPESLHRALVRYQANGVAA